MARTEFTQQHVNDVMTRLSDQFMQGWSTQLNKPEGKINIGNKMRTYKLFKGFSNRNLSFICYSGQTSNSPNKDKSQLS